MSRSEKLWQSWGQQLLCWVTIQHCPASRAEPRHFIATSLQRALSQSLQLSTFRRKSILNEMWARQQGCCGRRSSLSSAGSRLSQPGLNPRWSVSQPRDRQELSQTITALLLQACLLPWQGSGLCWSLAGACPCPCGFPCLCSLWLLAGAGGVCWGGKAGAVRNTSPSPDSVAKLIPH